MDYINIPIDIAKFDNNVTIWMLEAIILSLRSQVQDLSIGMILDRIVDTLKHNTYVNVANFKRTKVENGLMSGWKTTSIFGTLINYLVFKCVLKIANMPQPSYIATQGDDLDVSFK